MALFARTVRRSLLSSRPPTSATPFRAGITTVSHTLETVNVPEPLIQSGQHISQDLKSKVESTPSLPNSAPAPAPSTPPNARKDVVSTLITPSIRQMLPLLHSQPAHYITAHIHGRPYLVTQGDSIRLPFLMSHVKAGDVLRLNRATHIGSRDYTLKAPEAIKGNADHGKIVHYLDERLFTCRATVIGEEMEPVRVMEKTKRRRRHVKHVYSQHKYTVLRVGEVQVKSLEEYEAVIAAGKQ
ncbi:54S ribosomal protein L49, mitochondrial precursor [Bimuria novae-zelandiae CBS 107.79]|uniref:Large ribosomal subunit protein bL21m n=1 Tax=Bimuria novae-zelandiae CBS 107.79 TaxID=1447943 RepID=A0A6A5VPK9_9PLEO|nr:54S ribosomal protein L49, mitochondrial precursor [Bimuria novae-zelandiae CBS 107.79]